MTVCAEKHGHPCAPWLLINCILKDWSSNGCELSFQFSHSVMSDALRPNGLQHARPPCPSPTPIAYSTHVHHVGDAIQPSHPLLFPSPPAFSLSQHQGLFKWVGSSLQVAKVLGLQSRYWVDQKIHLGFYWCPRKTQRIFLANPILTTGPYSPPFFSFFPSTVEPKRVLLCLWLSEWVLLCCRTGYKH